MWTPESAVPKQILERLAQLESKQAAPAIYMAVFLEIVSALKSTKRTGWVDRSVPLPESIADHMYRMAIICMMSSQPVDVGRCVQIALVHDMAEAIVGDITPYAGVAKEEKHRRELASMEYLRDLVSKFNASAGALIYELWLEYENQTSPEAAIVKDVDKFELLAQASEYRRQHKHIDLDDFYGVQSSIKSKEVSEWAEGLNDYEKFQ